MNMYRKEPLSLIRTVLQNSGTSFTTKYEVMNSVREGGSYRVQSFKEIEYSFEKALKKARKFRFRNGFKSF